MDINTFIDKLKSLTTTENLLSVGREVNELRTHFDDFLLEEGRKKQVAFLVAKDNGEHVVYTEEIDPLQDEFYEIYTSYKAKRKELVDKRDNAQAENLKLKRGLIVKLKNIIENEENIGAAFGSYKEIHESWKKIGDIPREKRDEVQSEYSRLLEDFFYNMKIYKELKEHDLHRNEQKKLEVIQHIKDLQKIESIKEIESVIKSLQNEWEETGPASRDQWEPLKKAYWENCRTVYDRINVYYEDRRNEHKENLEKKTVILENVKVLISELNSLDTAKAWEEKTKQLIALQEEWKQIGFGPRKENEEIWKLFRSECDTFFAQKKIFFEEIKKEFDVLVDQKERLIEKAVKLQSSTDWKTTTEQLIQLQKKWKTIGNAGQRNEQRLWKEFRAVCDAFFKAKDAHFALLDESNEANLIEKRAVILTIEQHTLATDKKQALADLKAFATTFNEAGQVPSKSKDEIFKAYKAAMDLHYSTLDLKGEEKDKIMFEARIDTLKASPNAHRLFDKEKMDLRHKIDQLKQEVIQYENNMGFFGRSKGSLALKKDVESKIEFSKQKIEDLNRKIKMIPNE
jgi:hypothetical protein